MVQNKDEPLETFAIIPWGKFQSMEKRLKKEETSDEELPAAKPQTPEVEETAEKEVQPTPKDTTKKKDVKTKYRATQIKKLLHHIEKLGGSQKITSLENLEELIKCALGNSRKTLANEEEFFNFLFDNNLGHFVKNRSKINQYYDSASNWYEVWIQQSGSASKTTTLDSDTLGWS